MRGTDEFANNHARKLRRASTDAETALWYALRNRALNGYKFVRQAPIGPYFADSCAGITCWWSRSTDRNITTMRAMNGAMIAYCRKAVQSCG